MSKDSKPAYIPEDHVPLPPKEAEVFTTACDYCISGCGYKVYRWPVGKNGGPAADQNAYNADFPVATMAGVWASPNQHNIVSFEGKPHHITVIADKDTEAVNRGGDHSIRGGTIAKKCYNPNTLTRDRLKYPMVRVNGELKRVSWDDAIDIMAEVSKYVLDNYDKSAWAMKMYSYQYWENTHALTKLAFQKIKTPAWAVHDQPTGHGPDTPGMADAGIDNFSPAYEDWGLADVLFIAGTDPFESKTAIFNEWILPGIRRGMKVISVVPRKTTGVAYAEQNGGMHLEIIPGTDTLLLNAMARIIVENGWEDKTFVDKWINNRTERDTEVFQADGFADFKEWITSNKYAELDFAAGKTGIPAEQIRLAAEWLAKPNPDGSRKKASFGFEKGLYWSNNYLNTAAITALGLICGAGNRPGQVIGRFGGHQRGMMPGGAYPKEELPEKFPGWRKKGIDLDRWTEDGRVKFVWVVGTTWTQAGVASHHLADVFEKLTRSNPNQPDNLDKQHIIETYKKRIDSGGMVMVDQDIYPVAPINTRFADIVLPAATWGEEDFTRASGERRIRLYEKFYDSPGESLPDWRIVQKFAKRMGYSGFDWKDSNAVFEDAAFINKGRRTSYVALVEYARAHGHTGHGLLRDMGTSGITAPVRWEDGKLVGTKRLHDSTLKTGTAYGLTKIDPGWLRKFKTKTGRANLLKAPWEMFADYWEFMQPKGDELWVTTARINEFWQSGFDDQMRRPYLQQRWPDNFLEIHPDDAKARGIESGDIVRIAHDKIPVEVGGYTNSPKDLKARGVMPLYANADLETPDLLEQSVDKHANKESWTIDARTMGDAAQEMDDELMQFGAHPKPTSNGGKPMSPDLEQDDPIMHNLQSAIGLKWDDVKDMTFSEMQNNGYVEYVSASLEAVAIVTPAIRKGVTCSYFVLPSGKGAANALAGRILDPISQRPRYKLARGSVEKIGESEFKHSFAAMSFKSRAIV
ncbi:Assimilatory nitrate reductase large subunit [hydrothermal vent metagenome]|uniref:Assimilatory nitrate reductase large subunit n=1 Tax=hydrothermal vent metagenome TaxID=652676 RepID=A0A3B0YQZ1_9ZZZZ